MAVTRMKSSQVKSLFTPNPPVFHGGSGGPGASGGRRAIAPAWHRRARHDGGRGRTAAAIAAATAAARGGGIEGRRSEMDNGRARKDSTRQQPYRLCAGMWAFICRLWLVEERPDRDRETLAVQWPGLR